MPQTTSPPTGNLTANEFAELSAAHPDTRLPTIERRWVAVATGGHVSGLLWGSTAPELVLLHDAGGSARSWDDLLLAFGRPAVALDLPGHGRSNWRDRADYRPRRNAAPVDEAIRSFKGAGAPVVGRGLGALTAIALAARAPQLVGRLVLVDTLPGTLGATARPWPAASPTFADPEAAADWLAQRSHGLSAATVERETLLESNQNADGTWSWRHHLADLPADAPTDLDDESLWDQLAAIPAPLLVRAEAGALDDEVVQRFRAETRDGEVVTVAGSSHRVETDRPDALAELLRSLLN